jgi:hypothetical protein
MNKGQRALLGAIAEHLGIAGRAGGWLYRDGKPICHGWQEFWFLCVRRGWVVQYQWGTWIRQGVVCEGWRAEWEAMK